MSCKTRVLYRYIDLADPSVEASANETAMTGHHIIVPETPAAETTDKALLAAGEAAVPVAHDATVATSRVTSGTQLASMPTNKSAPVQFGPE